MSDLHECREERFSRFVCFGVAHVYFAIAGRPAADGIS
jgi:hypothetical protein